MRSRRLSGLIGATTLALSIGAPATTAGAATATGDTLYVAKGAACSDTGTGTQAQPYCTVQAAADAAQPGQTVQVAPGAYSEQVNLTHSGTADKPITFLGGSFHGGGNTMPRIGTGHGLLNGQSHGFTATGVQYVNVSGFNIFAKAETVLLTDTAHVTFDGNRINGGGMSAMAPAAIRLTGHSTGDTISRNSIGGYAWQSIAVEAGATGTVLTGNAMAQLSGADGINVTDDPGTVITGNSVATTCGTAVGLLGASSGAVVENNILAADSGDIANMLCEKRPTKLSVSAASEPGLTADYNLVNPYITHYNLDNRFQTGSAYQWGGTHYDTATEFTAASGGQGVHDLITDPQYSGSWAATGLRLQSTSPAIDSADDTAPDALAVDLNGYHRIDDPNVPNTGRNNGFYDRGALEYTDAYQVTGIKVPIWAVPTGAPVTIDFDSSGFWSPAVSYQVDFGDGTTPVVTTGTTIQHSYATPGEYEPKIVVTRANGDTSPPQTVYLAVSAPGPLVPALTVNPALGALAYSFDPGRTSSPWGYAAVTVDFGDGTSQGQTYPGALQHSYTAEGDYQVTLTVTDQDGHTAKTTQPLHVSYRPSGYTALTPTRVLDTRSGAADSSTLGPDQTLTIPLMSRGNTGLGALPFAQQPSAVVLNVTAIPKDSGGYLTVYPAGGKRPGTSSLNFTKDQAVPNLVTVPVGPTGDVAVYNKAGNVDVVADILGYYSPGSGDRFTTLSPSRLVDTRSAGVAGRLRAGQEMTVQVAGKGGVPAGASSAVLNLTSTGSDSGSYLTAYPTGATRPGTSNVNFAAGQTAANQVIVPLGADGKVTVYNHTGSTHVVADVFGYYSAAGQSLFTPVTPTRLLDTRKVGVPLGAYSLAIATAGVGVPAGATGAVLNVTSTGSTNDSYLTVWADGTPQPGTSDLNFTAGQTVANHVTTPLGADGAFSIANHTGTTDVIADLSGYFAK
ncbi:PKD domain-containing protein [Kitasatospora sp. MAP5-34]|uniref:PKD domain-containing protein n=1 Tax=Kitasatospora sp. MAP5-34 TaxID=3035102 RepID=UPI002475159B|nr:PKD domain-containing protein [Kitasatospora sp. MAP5-34]MDH6576320.1 PKD repeat protein [Kitasatospora sp. MAP5-34]